ncbi:MULTISPECIES: hypothetical protein [Acinetobacter]|uniref:Uncharacterized protein n=1 Tax=Acinetobacter indicus TaxID=756892 RepID=A0A856URQ0_9GAMM|nr:MULTISPECIES: hypothetical protein [Acinetobacter]MDM1331133.1 hypothetical protein [Acinetobacter indicus]MDM1339525.1 hypothetical protein [Acinetobacter indicus]QFS17771.1 hypothetical protein FHP22_09735 [Acinetobacter indicus]QIC76436.1 hypothetical protein FSC17_08235 [Acinetobacter indicus]QOW43841.1 hypothetical protein G0027_13945 [Acinetobacter indicus]
MIFYPRPVLPVFKTTGIRCLEPWLKTFNALFSSAKVGLTLSRQNKQAQTQKRLLEQEMSKNKKQYKTLRILPKIQM